MRAKIHRGAAEIGGSCIEVSADDGQRIVLDLGRPLWAEWGQAIELPKVNGFVDADASLLGLIVSHPHMDHYGLVPGVAEDVPLFIGREAARLLSAACFFTGGTNLSDPAGYLKDRTAFTLGPFTITPFRNDHSAFDAYSLLIEADGQRLFYTGDIRAHGRKRRLFEELLGDPPAAIDTLLMEGTHVRADDSHDSETFPRESDLEEQLAQLCRSTEGSVVMLGSAQNIDRVVTAYRAAIKSERQLVVDLYGATVAAASRPSIPQPGYPSYRVFLPKRQRSLVIKSREFERTDGVKAHRLYADDVQSHPERFLFYVTSSVAGELVQLGALTSAGAVVWSLWSGYLAKPTGLRLQELLGRHQIGMTSIHTSGHVAVIDLQRLVSAMNPGNVVPIHSEAGDRFTDLFPRVQRQADGAWWEVRSP